MKRLKSELLGVSSGSKLFAYGTNVVLGGLIYILFITLLSVKE